MELVAVMSAHISSAISCSGEGCSLSESFLVWGPGTLNMAIIAVWGKGMVRGLLSAVPCGSSLAGVFSEK